MVSYGNDQSMKKVKIINVITDQYWPLDLAVTVSLFPETLRRDSDDVAIEVTLGWKYKSIKNTGYVDLELG